MSPRVQHCYKAAVTRALPISPARAHQEVLGSMPGTSHHLALRATSGRGRAPVHKNELEAGLCQSRQEDKKYQVKLLVKPIVVRRVATAMPGRANPKRKGAHAS